MKLRRYQLDAIDNIYAGSKNYNSIIFCSPTGSGKTIIIGEVIRQMVKAGLRVVFLTHRKSLLKQSGDKFNVFGVETEYISADTNTDKLDKDAKLYTCMTQTLKRRQDQETYIKIIQNVNYVIIDEAHDSSSDWIFEHLRPSQKVIGLSATPERLVGVPLIEYYQHIVFGPTVNELIKDGYLAKPVYYSDNIDLTGVRSSAKDFMTKDLEEKLLPHLDAVYATYIKHAHGKTLIFTPSIELAEKLTTFLNDKKLKCVLVHSEMKSSLRDKNMEDFKSGKIQIMVNVDILTTGFDLPDIETLILFRPTKSRVLFNQAIGRGSRVTNDKTHFYIIDLGSNLERHGFWHYNYPWELKKKKKPREGEFKLKVCPTCKSVYPMAQSECVYCGYVFKDFVRDKYGDDIPELFKYEWTEKIELKREDAERIKKMSYDDLKVLLKKHKNDIELLELIRLIRGYKKNWIVRFLKNNNPKMEAFQELGKLRGYKNSWAYMMFYKI